MKGNEVYKSSYAGHLVTERSARTESGDQLDGFIPHQANIRIIEAIASGSISDGAGHRDRSTPRATRLPRRCRWRSYGYRDGRISAANCSLLGAFGGGFTWGSALIRIDGRS